MQCYWFWKLATNGQKGDTRINQSVAENKFLTNKRLEGNRPDTTLVPKSNQEIDSDRGCGTSGKDNREGVAGIQNPKEKTVNIYGALKLAHWWSGYSELFVGITGYLVNIWHL